MTVAPVRNPTYVTMSDGSIRNTYDVRLRNKHGEERELQLAVTGNPDLSAGNRGHARCRGPGAGRQHLQHRVYVTAPAGSDAARADVPMSACGSRTPPTATAPTRTRSSTEGTTDVGTTDHRAPRLHRLRGGIRRDHHGQPFHGLSAVSTFPGLEVRNSYVASQSFDERRAAQEALGWTVRADHADGMMVLRITGADGAAGRGPSRSRCRWAGRPGGDDQSPDFSLTGPPMSRRWNWPDGNWGTSGCRAPDGTPFRQRFVNVTKDKPWQHHAPNARFGLSGLFRRPGGRGAGRTRAAMRDARIALSLPTIHCSACISKIERALDAHPGVRDARVNLTLKRAQVEAAPDVTAQDLIATLEGHRLRGARTGPRHASPPPRPTRPGATC